MEKGLVKNGVDVLSVEGMANQPYAIPNLRVDLTTTTSPVSVLWWRSVGSTHTAYALETFIDEIAHAVGKDPVEFRLAMLKDKPRHAAVLRLAAEKAGWSTPSPPADFVGLQLPSHSILMSHKSRRSQSITPDVRRCIASYAPSIVALRLIPIRCAHKWREASAFGLGAILKSQITLDKGRIVEGNFDGYDVLKIDEMPSVEVYIVKSSAPPTGVGEPGVPPIGPAVANATFKATGRRIRILPFANSDNS